MMRRKVKWKNKIAKFSSRRSPLRQYRNKWVSVYCQFCSCLKAELLLLPRCIWEARWNTCEQQGRNRGWWRQAQIVRKVKNCTVQSTAPAWDQAYLITEPILLWMWEVKRQSYFSACIPPLIYFPLLTKKKKKRNQVKWGSKATEGLAMVSRVADSGSAFRHVLGFLMGTGMAPDRLNINHLDSFV